MTIADIETLTRFLTKTTTVSLTAPNLLIIENKYYEEITGKILSETAGGEWPYGDSNYTAFPDYTENLVDSQAEYDIGAFGTGGDETPLVILGVEVLNVDGIYETLRPITLQELTERGTAQTEFFKTDGKPQFYEKRENLIVLYPAPDNGVNVTFASGLKVFYLRRADIFTSAEVTTGTKEPGFPSPWHDLLSYGPAYDVALANGLSSANGFKAEYDRRLKEMLDFLSIRNQDDRKVLTMRNAGHDDFYYGYTRHHGHYR